MKKVKLKEVLKQQRDVFEIKDNEEYKQVTVSNTGEIKLRAIKKGTEIGTKKQYRITLTPGNSLVNKKSRLSRVNRLYCFFPPRGLKYVTFS